MDLPKTLTIGPNLWHVDTLDGADGLCVFERTLFVRTEGRSDADVLNSLIHEALHAAFPDGEVDDETEEQLVSALAEHLTPTVMELLQVRKSGAVLPIFKEPT